MCTCDSDDFQITPEKLSGLNGNIDFKFREYKFRQSSFSIYSHALLLILLHVDN